MLKTLKVHWIWWKTRGLVTLLKWQLGERIDTWSTISDLYILFKPIEKTIFKNGRSPNLLITRFQATEGHTLVSFVWNTVWEGEWKFPKGPNLPQRKDGPQKIDLLQKGTFNYIRTGTILEFFHYCFCSVRDFMFYHRIDLAHFLDQTSSLQHGSKLSEIPVVSSDTYFCVWYTREMEFPVHFLQKSNPIQTHVQWGKLGDSLQNHSTAKPNPTTVHAGGRKVLS